MDGSPPSKAQMETIVVNKASDVPRMGKIGANAVPGRAPTGRDSSQLHAMIFRLETLHWQRPTRRLLICLVCVGALVVPRRGKLAAAELTAKQVVESIDRAKRALLKAQQGDGSWKTG